MTGKTFADLPPAAFSYINYLHFCTQTNHVCMSKIEAESRSNSLGTLIRKLDAMKTSCNPALAKYAFLHSHIARSHHPLIYASKAAGNLRMLSASLPLLDRNWT